MVEAAGVRVHAESEARRGDRVASDRRRLTYIIVSLLRT
jgi:hypothetical protein